MNLDRQLAIQHEAASFDRAKPNATIRWMEAFLCASTIVILALAIISVIVPLVTIGFDVEKSYNEGWNAYRAAQVAAGMPLYTGDPTRLVNYPFLSFYLIAWLKPVFGNVLLIGRGLNVIAFAMTTLLSSLIIRRLGGRPVAMMFGAACVIGFQAIQALDWIATDEPQMLAQALMLGGLLCYLSGKPDLWRLALCAGLFATGGFIKPNLPAIPLAVSLDLLVEDRQRFIPWCICCAAALAVFVALSEALSGNGFWPEIFAPRAYEWGGLLYHGRKLLIAFKWPILASVVYLVRPLPSRQRVLLRAFGATAFLCDLSFSGGYGVASNIFLEFTIFLGLTAGLALDPCQEALLQGKFRLPRAALAPLVFALPIVTRSPYYGRPPLDVTASLTAYSEEEADFHAATVRLREEPGAALCENLLLCFEAGKPLLLDPFSTNSQILTGRLNEATIVDQIAHHRFAAIELPSRIHPDPEQPHKFAPYLLNQGRFNVQTLQAIDRYYEAERRIGGVLLLKPRD